MNDLISRQDALECVSYDVEDTILRLENLPSAEPEINNQELIRIMNTGIIATNTEDVYSCGMRNGIRWCRALLEDDPPKFEDANQYAQPERKKGKWIKIPEFCGDDVSGFIDNHFSCSECKKEAEINSWGFYILSDFCPNCGADMRGEQDETD